jgi:hypothetical protein
MSKVLCNPAVFMSSSRRSRKRCSVNLGLKSKAGRAFNTLFLDLGHVLSEPDPPPRGPRNAYRFCCQIGVF